MIDLAVFEQEMAILMDWFNRDLEKATLKRLYQCLSEKLTTEQFVQASQIVFQTCRFFPTVAEFVSAVKSNPETQALEEWELLVKAAARNDRDMITQLSPQARSALQLVGGLYKLGMATDEELRWIKKEFVAVWKSTPANARSLAPATSIDADLSEPIQLRGEQLSLNGATR